MSAQTVWEDHTLSQGHPLMPERNMQGHVQALKVSRLKGETQCSSCGHRA